MKNSALIKKTQIANLKIIMTEICKFEGGERKVKLVKLVLSTTLEL